MPARDELLLEAAQACIVRAASKLRAALDAYTRAGADPGVVDDLREAIDLVELLADCDA